MYNYYSDQKKKEIYINEEKKEMKKIIIRKINKIKNEKLVKNYEKRLKLYLSSNNIKENNAIKTFYHFLPSYNSRNISPKNNRNLNKANKIVLNNIKNCKSEDKNSYISPKPLYDHIILSTSNIENNKIYQPRLRFTPRNELERIFYEIKDERLFHTNLNYIKELKKKILKLRNKEFMKETQINNIKTSFNKFFVSKERAKNNLDKFFVDMKKTNPNFFHKGGDGLNIANIGHIKKHFLGHVNKYIVEDESISLDDAQIDINNNLSNGYIEYVDIRDKLKKDYLDKIRNKILNPKLKSIIKIKKRLHKNYDNKRYFISLKDSALKTKLNNNILSYADYKYDGNNSFSNWDINNKDFNKTFFKKKINSDKQQLNIKDQKNIILNSGKMNLILNDFRYMYDKLNKYLYHFSN